MRVHELAKELGIPSKECIQRLTDLGVEVKSHMSVVEADAVALLKPDSAPAKAAEKPAKAEKTPAKAPAKSEKSVAKPAAKKAPAKKAPAPDVEAKPAPKAPAPAPEPVAPVAATAPAAKAAASSEPEDDEKVLRVKGPVVVGELAKLLGLRPNVVITELMKRNILASINQTVDINMAREIAEKHGYTLSNEKRATEAHQAAAAKQSRFIEDDEVDVPEDLEHRSPVITFLGHVDHGKTSLLDYIRKARVAAGEHGGITQHIGAYTVDHNGQKITFLDTPGHAAFTAMRARGANLTDIAVIIVAADDGLMPQTREAIQHVQAAGVEMMVAINKSDLPAANIDNVKQQLQAEELTPEDWGGSLICCPVSAMTGDGVDQLLEMISLQSEVLELQANPKRRAKGFVIEAQLEQGRGSTASVLVTTGTLRIGDFVLCGEHCGKVKALVNDRGEVVKSAGPSTPVNVLGLSGVPEAGAEFTVYSNERVARARAEEIGQQRKEVSLVAPQKASLESLFSQLEEDSKIELKIVLKADTQGSLEAIEHSLGEITSAKISQNIILSNTGNISENDVMLASASNAVVIGFHVGREPGVDSACKREGVEIRSHHVIYELLDEVREAMTGMLAPEYEELQNGTVEVLQVFSMGKVVQVAGSRVIKGTVRAKDRARVRRGDEILFEGRVDTLRHFQDQVAEVKEAQECGVRLAGFNAFEEGDRIDFYVVEELEKKL